MIMLEDKQVDLLKNKIHSKEDLKNILKEYKVNFTETTLDNCYDELINKSVLSLDELEDINGGYARAAEATKKATKCWNCRKHILVDVNPKYETKCPKCGKLNNYNNCHDGC